MTYLETPLHTDSMTGSIEVEEFIAGCCRIHGPAKARSTPSKSLQRGRWTATAAGRPSILPRSCARQGLQCLCLWLGSLRCGM